MKGMKASTLSIVTSYLGSLSIIGVLKFFLMHLHIGQPTRGQKSEKEATNYM